MPSYYNFHNSSDKSRPDLKIIRLPAAEDPAKVHEMPTMPPWGEAPPDDMAGQNRSFDWTD